MTDPGGVMQREGAATRPVVAAAGCSGLGLLGLLGLGAVLGVLLAGTEAGGSPVVQAVAALPGALEVVRELTGLGGPVAAAVVLTLACSAALLQGERRTGAFVAVTGLGAAVLGAGSGAVVGAIVPGAAGPDGHSLSAAVAYGVLLVVVTPAVPPRWRRDAGGAAVVVVVLVGLTRLALGHPPGPVVLGGLLGASWLAVTTAAFGRPRPPGPARSPGTATSSVPGHLQAVEPRPTAPAPPVQRAGALAGVWLLLLGLLVAAGALVTGSAPVQRADAAVTAWFVAVRTPSRTVVAEVGSALGDTPTIVAGALALAVLTAAATRSGRPVLLVVLVLGGELALFLLSGGVVDRPRPAVGHLGLLLPPTSSFPSGHVSAAVCLYGLAALLAAHRLAPRQRWLPLAGATAAVVAVAGGRLYFGVHHPTDVLASLLFAVPWLLACRRSGPRVAAGRPR